MAFLCGLPYSVRGMNASSDFPSDAGVRVAEHRPNTRVITVVGEIDTPTALELTNSLIAQLTVARVVIVDLDAVSFLDLLGCSQYSRRTNSLPNKTAPCDWRATLESPSRRWRPPGCKNTSSSPTAYQEP